MQLSERFRLEILLLLLCLYQQQQQSFDGVRLKFPNDGIALSIDGGMERKRRREGNCKDLIINKQPSIDNFSH